MPANVTWLTPQGVVSKLINLQPVSLQLSASGDPPISYTLVDGSLPDGLFLLSNGYIYGNTSVVATTTTSNFSILASSAESEAVGDFTFIQKPITETVWKSPANNSVQTVILQSSNVNIPLLASASYANFVNYYSNSLPNGVSIIGNRLTGLITGNTNLINNTSIITASTVNGDITNSVYINWNLSGYSNVIVGTYTATITSSSSWSEGNSIDIFFNSNNIPAGTRIEYTSQVRSTAGLVQRGQIFPETGYFIFNGSNSNITVFGIDDERTEDNQNVTFTFFTSTTSNAVLYPLTSNIITLVDVSNNNNTPNSTEAVYVVAGSYTFVVPAGISNVAAVAVGGGGGGAHYSFGFIGGPGPDGGGEGGGGGSLAWKNCIAVTGGSSLTVTVGCAGFSPDVNNYAGPAGGNSWFIGTNCLFASGGQGGTVRRCGQAGWDPATGIYISRPHLWCIVGDGGGRGGRAGGNWQNNTTCVHGTGGGGAGGYLGNGGNGGVSACAGIAESGSGGGGGGGAAGSVRSGVVGPFPNMNGGRGGGVGIWGIGVSGNAGIYVETPIQAGNVGTDGSNVHPTCFAAFGGGGAGTAYLCNNPGKTGNVGAVRIIYGSGTRCFPNINVGNTIAYTWSPNVTNNIGSNLFITYSNVTSFAQFNATGSNGIQYSVLTSNVPGNYTFANVSNGYLLITPAVTNTRQFGIIKVRARDDSNNDLFFNYNIMVEPGEFRIVSPSNNSVIPIYQYKNNVDVVFNLVNTLNSNVILSSNNLPDGMYIIGNAIKGMPLGTTNLLPGNVSFINAVVANSNINSNIYLNWNLLQTNNEVYIVTSNTNVVYEGNTVTYTISTFNVPNNTILYWQAEVIEGNAFNLANVGRRKRNQLTIPQTSDIYTGNVTIVNSTAQVELTANNDGTREVYPDALNFYVSRFPDSVAPVLAAAPSVSILDSNEFGQIQFTTPGTYTLIGWGKPVSVVVVGGGAAGDSYAGPGGGGGGLGWRNNVMLLPCVGYAIVVGCGGAPFVNPASNSYFISETCVFGGAGGSRSANNQIGGGYVGEGGGEGGPGGRGTGLLPIYPGGGCYGIGGGGGGAGGYCGNGGHGANANLLTCSGTAGCGWISLFQANGSPGWGGGGGGGGVTYEQSFPYLGRRCAGGGGNVSLCGLITSVGPYGNTSLGGESNYCYGPGYSYQPAVRGGGWGRAQSGAGIGAGGSGACSDPFGGGGQGFGCAGAVRIIWGPGRFFPNTCVLDM